jgi:hypothetical protein
MEGTDRRALLVDLTGLASDADHHPDMLRVFLPLPSHRQALEPRTLVVRGERGAGKTALFHALRALATKKIPLSGVFRNLLGGEWVEGFSEVGTAHPATDVLDEWGIQVGDPALLRTFWLGHLVGRLSTHHPSRGLPPAFAEAWSHHRGDPAAWVPAARAQLPALTSWLDAFDAESTSFVFVSYDHLDKIGVTRPALRQGFASALLGLWLSLSNRYTRLRGKVFLREDLFQGALHGSADASKLETRSSPLHWSAEDLFRMFLRHLGAFDGLRGWLQGGESFPVYTHDEVLGHMPPEALPEDGGFSQKRVAERLAGPQMGEGVKKGYTHRWIPNHLQDAHGAIGPRSMLNLLAFAAQEALRRGPQGQYTRLLHHTELQAALEKTSRYRVQELVEEHKVVQRLEALRGITLLSERAEVVRRLAPRGKDPDGFEADGEQVFDELERLGVLKTREDGRIDVPDIYRFGFGIKRKGGTARPR